MRRLAWCLVISFLALCPLTLTARASDKGGGAVVSSEVIDVQYVKGEGHRATVKIVHVYTGPKELLKTTFINHTADAGSDNGSVAIPILKFGETGLWLLATDENTGRLFVAGIYRKDHIKNYARRIEWAVELERLYKLDVTKRLKAAQELCTHKTPEVAQLGIDVMFEAMPDDAKAAGASDFFTALPKNRQVTHAALVHADRLHERRDGKKWVGSDGQKALFARFTEVLTEPDAVEVVNHVIRTRHLQSPDGVVLTAEEAAGLLRKIATDPKQTKEVRQIVVARVVEVANNAGVRPDFTFDVLAAAVRGGVDDATRLLAAKGLARFRWKAAAQLGELTALIAGEKDADVLKALTEAFDKSK